jgi:D-3-phosphoglycerate dehydrogenase
MVYKYRALVTAPPILPKIFNYKNLFDKKSVEIVVPPYEVVECLYENELVELLKNIDGILCGDDKITENVLKQTKRLKVISKWGTGIDSIDKDAAERLGIKVLRVKDVFSEPVSDTVLAYILLFSRKIIEKNQIVINNKWEKTESHTLKEKSLGIIGVGHIGKVVAQKALALGMKVYGNDIRKISRDYVKNTDIEMVNLNELLTNSDFVTFHCDLNNSSFHLIGEKELKIMKPESVLINTSRGEVIDQSALEDALQNNEISGAALDVFEVEPLPEESILRKMNNVFLSPHNSNGSPQVFNKVDELSIQNLFTGLGI